MSEDGGWLNRFIREARQTRDLYISQVTSGSCQHDVYLALCGQIATLTWVIDSIPKFIRGDDLRQAKPEPLQSVEE